MNKEVTDPIDQMCDGYTAALKPGKSADFFRSYKAAAAVRAARWPVARTALDGMSNHLAPEAFRTIGLMSDYAAAQVYAFTGSQADALVAAEQKAAMHQIGEAITVFQAASDRFKNDKSPDARAAHYVNSRLQQLQWERQFATGQWVDVQPSDPAMPGWEPILGSWTVEQDGALTGKADDHGLLLTFCGTYLAPRFEIDGELDLPPLGGGTTYFGMSLANAQPARFAGWWITRTGDKIDCYN